MKFTGISESEIWRSRSHELQFENRIRKEGEAGAGSQTLCRLWSRHCSQWRAPRALDEGDKAVVSNATSCLEVSTFIYPYTAYEDSYIHSAFENAAAMTGGVETAYKVLKKEGKIDETYKFICFGGDGGTYDIGFQSLSGAMGRVTTWSTSATTMRHT